MTMHQKIDDRRSVPPEPLAGACPVARFADARAVLRDGSMRQAGFRADLIARYGDERYAPILFQHGERHRKQRAATARFFAPKVVGTHHRAVMEREADALTAELKSTGTAALDDLAMRLAVAVAAEIVGLTDSDNEAMSRRLDRFFDAGVMTPGGLVVDLARFVRGQAHLWNFYLHDVRPAIRARRRAPREDVISQLLADGWSDRAILTECVTYAAAGMVTTREFITMAGWTMLEREDVRARFMEADEDGRIALLEEILRLEPVVGILRRRDEAGHDTAIDIRAVNADPAAIGACPHALNLDRERAERVDAAGLSFGDGPHRCPGASVAMLESAVFLGKLFEQPDLRLERTPALRWNPLVTGYELRGCRIAI